MNPKKHYEGHSTAGILQVLQALWTILLPLYIGPSLVFYHDCALDARSTPRWACHGKRAVGQPVVHSNQAKANCKGATLQCRHLIASTPPGGYALLLRNSDAAGAIWRAYESLQAHDSRRLCCRGDG
ncbi:hypothetical protein ACN47E_009491 [Coniothyrium glycines]